MDGWELDWRVVEEGDWCHRLLTEAGLADLYFMRQYISITVILDGISTVKIENLS